MNTSAPLAKPLAVAISLALLQITNAYAQTASAESPNKAPVQVAQAATPPTTPAPAADAGTEDALKLDRVVVTGTSTARTKLKQSVSVSTIDGDAVLKSQAASAAEVLRSVPGIRAESTGGEGNANLGVRGIPIADGGGRYVQLQQDGLPILLFGDIAFGTADQFYRTTYSLDTIEAIRGGSAATLSTNSSGAIINFRSKTGKEAGGAVGLTAGIGFNEQRGDFNYGGSLGNGMYYNVGGFYRIGQGPRPTNIKAEKGGEINASFTKEFSGGFVRVNVKHLDDTTPTYLPVPVKLSGNVVSEINGIDPRRAFFISSNFPSNNVIDQAGNKITTNPKDGLSVKNDSIGLEASYKFGDGFTFTDRFRTSSIDGRFIGLYTPGNGTPSAAYKGSTPTFQGVLFDTALNDLGNTFNDARISNEIKIDATSKITVMGGLFLGKQKVAETWDWNNYNVELTGKNPRLFDNAGNVTTAAAGNAFNTFGGCCFRDFDLTVKATAPYAAVTFDAGPLSIDASVRKDTQKGSGYFRTASAATGNWDPTSQITANFKSSATSYSVGGNYELDRNMAVFARLSHGASWKAVDRADTRQLRGLDPYGINKVDSQELGIKLRQGPASAFITLFNAKTKEAGGFVLTSQSFEQKSYKSSGVEAEAALKFGGLRIAGGATITNASITSSTNDPKNVGNTPKRQAKFIYQITPSYSQDNWEIGGSLIGTTKSYAGDDNTAILPAFAAINLFANYDVTRNVSVNFGVNNLANKIGYTEDFRSINGRTAKLGVKFTF
jgi:outer membrane receptor protein involved in Fe transport